MVIRAITICAGSHGGFGTIALGSALGSAGVCARRVCRTTVQGSQGHEDAMLNNLNVMRVL